MGCHFLTEQTAKSTESSQVVVAGAGDSPDVRPHVEFGVEVDSEIADFSGWLYCVGTDVDELVASRELAEVCCQAEPHHLSFLGV